VNFDAQSDTERLLQQKEREVRQRDRCMVDSFCVFSNYEQRVNMNDEYRRKSGIEAKKTGESESQQLALMSKLDYAPRSCKSSSNYYYQNRVPSWPSDHVVLLLEHLEAFKMEFCEEHSCKVPLEIRVNSAKAG
jgi:uncharacterized protein